MITNAEEIKIEQIRDLKSIHFIDVTEGASKENSYLSLKVTYDKDKVIKYNYLDEYFPLLLRKVISLYHDTSEKNKIVFIGNNTERTIRDLDKLYRDIDNKNEIPYVQSYPVAENSTQRFKVKLIEGMIDDLSKSLILLDEDTAGYHYTGLVGYKDRYSITYERNNETYFIPISLNSTVKGYHFKVSNIGQRVYNIEGDINFYDAAATITWQDKTTSLQGKIAYSLRKENEQNIIKYGFKTVAIDKLTKRTNTQKDNLIKQYADMYNITLQSINQSTDNIYFQGSRSIDNGIISSQNSYFYIDDDIVNIKIKNKKSLKYNEQFNLDLESNNIDIVLREVMIDGKKYVLEQTHYLPTKSTGEYKYFLEDKYKYRIHEINTDDSITKEFTIINTYDVEKPISSVEDIGQIINSSKKGAKTYGVLGQIQ